VISGTIYRRGAVDYGNGYRILGLAMLVIGLVWTYRHMKRKK
jgi:hypothetical protein